MKLFPQIEYFNVSIFASDTQKGILESTKKEAIFNVKPRTLRLSFNPVNLYADPFLFVHENELYLFLERKRRQENGQIVVYKTNDLVSWKYLGVAFSLPIHVSFPFVFKDGDNIFMIPEASGNRTVDLYISEQFPLKWRYFKTLLSGDGFLDSHVFKHENIYYLFTNTQKGLQLFYSSDLLSQWVEHPKSPIVSDVSIERSAGGIVKIDDKIFRLGQDCLAGYGDNFGFFEIKDISENNYEEKVFIPKMIDYSQKWNRKGGHHFSCVEYKDKYIVAMDGKMKANCLDSLTYYPFRILDKIFFKK